ncbi:pyridoxal phosphate-dependent decarboxylase family protein [Actinocrispum wychmicini]|uniref:Glutamate/tyrosine decarboxylase-like PLP-dependent enzyme n=1 Tax=Actinocrispum wychmicini TaxID=1213861 RepID=A0A4R2JYD6_9PSEU|nr:aminotransferase class I/II-fold pyridoxal phosphate-dependent enzyme [Actinocrispum wychmicini]TCO62448.1 glutamate/tyrosine decarboxylase-like PLP-dependent enzyme [Actinocrispum wychmicini]
MDLKNWLVQAAAAHDQWAEGFGPFTRHPVTQVDEGRFAAAFAELTERLAGDNPYFHPRYAGQMQKPPHPAAVAGYLATMLNNPNNHALDGGPATARMEREVVADLATMFGFDTHLGHLTSSGTIANLEALFVARETHPGRGVAYSAESHYTHPRMCHVLGMPAHQVPVDGQGRMDLTALEDLLAKAKIGTVVLTAGTTSLGAVDPIDEALSLKERYGVRIHVDAAYGGFHRLLAEPAGPWQAIARCDSVVVDPHKHGLQPYGCGAVLFADPAVGRFYLHDSPYTYFTSDELHPGEISLECSRSGAAAAALWLTLRLFPLTRDGLGEVLAASRRAALDLATRIDQCAPLTLYQWPTLDIVTYFAGTELAAIDTNSNRILHEGMAHPADPVFLSTLRVTADAMTARHPNIAADTDGGRILRSVLMKPESEYHTEQLHTRLVTLAS